MDRIMVLCEQTGDTAYCNDQDEAVVAGRTLMQDAYENNPTWGYQDTLHCSFYADGMLVRQGLSWRELNG